LRLLEAEVGETFVVQHAKGAELTKDAKQRAEKSVPNFKPTSNSDYADGVTEMITVAIYGQGRLNNFSRHKGLWNHALDLPEEDLVDTIKRVVKDPTQKD
jgi:hypothetical protein